VYPYPTGLRILPHHLPQFLEGVSTRTNGHTHLNRYKNG